MTSEQRIKQAFAGVRADMNSMKNEVAFLAKRIAQVEALLIKAEVEGKKKAVSTQKGTKAKTAKKSSKKKK